MNDKGLGWDLRKNNYRGAKTVWALGVLAFIAPALVGWAILAFGHYKGCAFGAAACGPVPVLGSAFKVTLEVAWALGMDALVLVPLGLVVALAAILARSPGRAFIGVFAGPTLALFLPVLVVMSAHYPGCTISENGGGCTFWGVAMGNSFSAAAIAPWLVYIIPPVGFAAALAVMLVAYVVKRQRA